MTKNVIAHFILGVRCIGILHICIQLNILGGQREQQCSVGQSLKTFQKHHHAETKLGAGPGRGVILKTSKQKLGKIFSWENLSQMS